MDNNIQAAGIDIGSRTIKFSLLKGNEIIYQKKIPTTCNPIFQCRKILEEVKVKKIVSTGYGRKLFASNMTNIKTKSITEIQAFALGGRFLNPQIRSILDIGGQDTKVISLKENGKINKFEMNDRCAAGTGKFFEIMATSLQIPLESFGQYAQKADKNISINSMCTVFAESEVTSLIAQGEKGENIAMGIHSSIIQRTVAMLNRVGIKFPLMFAGGVAHNSLVKKLLQDEIKNKITIPEKPDMVGAIGAALYCRNF